MAKDKKDPPATIAVNRKARHEYTLGEVFEAGMVLEGWEVKAMRAGKCNLSDSYVMVKDGEVFLFGCQIQPLQTASTHIHPDPLRTRKLLLNNREISRILGAVTREGDTCIPLKIFWKHGLAKCDIALATGKKLHDKRESEKTRDWERERGRLLRTRNKG
ncbi:MAG: SsrA-binding protein SmpB [Pseudomonadota bacterium]